MSFCEIRVPTYKRPVWLRRALESLIAQDQPNWKALVMDDSPEREGREVVGALRDKRIIYQPNRERLGGAANLDKAFNSESLLGGAWACVLEDDNWLMPGFLSENIHALDDTHVDILLRNQEIWFQNENTTIPTGQTTRGNWFEEREYDSLELHAFLFFFEAISNGGLFWKTSIKSNLQVGNKVKDSGLQESCRTLQIVEPLYFKSKPLCVWSQMPAELISRSFVSNRARTRGKQSIVRYLIQKYKEDIVVIAKNKSFDFAREEEFEVTLLDALYTKHNFQFIRDAGAIKRYIKSYAKYKLVDDPLKDYFSDWADNEKFKPITERGGLTVPSVDS